MLAKNARHDIVSCLKRRGIDLSGVLSHVGSHLGHLPRRKPLWDQEVEGMGEDWTVVDRKKGRQNKSGSSSHGGTVRSSEWSLVPDERQLRSDC
jgi:hypothetical protein